MVVLQKICIYMQNKKSATSHIFMGTPQLAFAICGSKEYLVNMQESKNKS